MSVGATNAPGGGLGVVSAADDDVSQKRTRSLVDEDSLSSEAKEALEADDFIVYGKASVEQYDEDWPPQKLVMESFEEKMEQFFDPGLISRRHKDIPVGEALREHELEEDTTVNVGGEELSFGAGDVLNTGIHDDELWVVANIRNDSEIARETRLGILEGELDGFSVTVFCKEWMETPKGQEVLDFDWHSITIGSDEQIKNKPSRFGLAEYKAFFESAGVDGTDEAAKAAVELFGAINRDMGTETESPEDSKGFWGRIRDAAAQKADEEDEMDYDEEENSKEGGDYDDEEDEESKSEETGQEGDVVVEDDTDDSEVNDVANVLEKASESLSDKDVAVLKQAIEDPEENDAGTEDDLEDLEDEEMGELKEDDEDDEGDAVARYAEEELKALEDRVAGLESKLDSVVTEEQLKAALPSLPEGEVATKADIEAVMKAAESVLTEDVPDLIDESVSTKATVGSTPNPDTSMTQAERDYREEIQKRFGSKGGSE